MPIINPSPTACAPAAAPPRRIVREQVIFELLTAGGGRAAVPVLTRLRWADRDPHTVELTFATGGTDGREVRWHVGRDLLAAGLDGPAGVGDVSVLPDLHDPTLRELVLSSPDGRACLRFRAADLAGFLSGLPATAGGCGR